MNNWRPTTPKFSLHKKEVFKKAATVSSFIYQIGDDTRLRQPSQSVSSTIITSTHFKQKLSYLKKCLVRYRELTGYGRGITAIQVGIPERFSVIYTPKKIITIINPKIKKQSKKFYKYPEICMSANPIIAPTIRPAWIEFEYLDEKGSRQAWDMKDDTELGRMMNRVIQHEIDHMDGIINIDRVKDPKELILESDPDFYKTAMFEKIK